MNKVPNSSCPNCGLLHNAATSADLDDAIPEPGDLTVCFGCAAVNRFGPDMRLEWVDPKAVDSFDEETRTAVLNAVRTVERMKRFGLRMPDGGEG